jgi:hypothetical protein
MMRTGGWVSSAALAACLGLMWVAPAAAQSATPSGADGRTEKGYVAPRLAIGQPDLTGVWTNSSNTTLTRPSQFKSLTMSDAEAAEARAKNPSNIRQATDDNQKTSDGLLDGKDLNAGRGYNAFWIDPGNNYANVKGTWRTSWIVDPPNGTIPFSAEGRKLASARRTGRGSGYDNPEERALGERCIIGFGGTGGPPMMNVLYNNNYQIIQSPDHVVIVVEMVHDARIIPLKGKHRPDAMKPYLGDSIGWWDGDTLVVETINLHPNQQIGGGQVSLTEKGKITERFTRYNDNQVLYEFEVDDPTLYTQVWKGEVGMNKVDGNMYEYACHEGNYGLEGILAGGRANDRAGKNNRVNGDRDEG